MVVITVNTVDIGVDNTASTVVMLSRLKEDSILDRDRVFLSKKEWAKSLGICEMSIIRWERNIIAPSVSLRVNYWNMKGNLARIKQFNSGKTLGYRLDYFQRFVLACIRLAKMGAFKTTPLRSDRELILWLKESETGKTISYWFDRDNFKIN